MLKRFTYVDPVHGNRGWLVYDGAEARLSVGGCRVQAGLTVQRLDRLAANMTRKQRVLGLFIDGAKCGLDLAPEAPYKAEVLGRFIAFLGPHLAERFSMGCDMGTTFRELERHAHGQGLPSVKHAIARAQGLTETAYQARIAVLDQPVGAMTVGERRAGHALAHVAIAAGRRRRLGAPPTYAVQGFGTLGRATAYSLYEAGMTLVAVADLDGCVWNEDGLDVPGMLKLDPRESVLHTAVAAARGGTEELFGRSADTLVLAATEDGVSRAAATGLRAATVVVGANCGLSNAAHTVLEERGVFVIPDFVGGAGGSASMEALFGPLDAPGPREVLDTVKRMMGRLVDELVDEAHRRDGTVTAAALARIRNSTVVAGRTPYGHSTLWDRLGDPDGGERHGVLIAVAPRNEGDER
jgi:glutamate dehydrogenase (NAD(P)+)